MAVEIEFRAVGNESKGGDAIIVCLGPTQGPRQLQTIIVVDGGYKANGDDIVAAINEWYHTDVVDLVVSTHPDQDHISGLFTVIENMTVRELWMHLPWDHSADLAALRRHSFKSDKLPDFVEASLTQASTLDELARRHGIPIVEPFSGVSIADGQFMILGPDPDFYAQQLALIPEDARSSPGLVTKLSEMTKRAVRFVEDLFTDNLSDDEVTSPRNNTSVISLIRDPDSSYRALLTADAGIPALEQIVPRLRSADVMPGDLDLVQVPHHGSRHNVGPSVLNELLGTPGVDGGRGCAVASVPAKNPDGRHPNKRVTNAFRRRGYAVTVSTSNIYVSRPKNSRPGYSPVSPLPFFHEFEDDE